MKTPYLIATGETLTCLSQVFLVVETELISEFTCLRKARPLLPSYIFDTAYPREAKNTLISFDSFFGIHREKLPQAALTAVSGMQNLVV